MSKNIPKEWTQTKLGKILSKSYKNGIYKSSDYYGKGISILRINDFDNQGNRSSTKLQKVQLNEKEIRNYKLNINDIVVNRVNSLTHLGKSILWNDSKITAVYESNMMRIDPDEQIIEPAFLIRILHHEPSRIFFRRMAKRAVAQSSINQQDVKALPVLLPPLPEQKAIADLLSTWDEAIEKTERLIQAKERRFKWLLREFISEPRNTRKGTEWKKVKLGDLFEKDIKVEKGKALTKESNIEGDIPVVAGGQTYAYYTSRPTHVMPSVTISASGAYAGFVWYHDYPIWASDCNVLYVTKGSTKFLYFTLKAIQHRVYALQSGGAQPHVYSKDMKILHVFWPSPEEQQQIAETLSSAQQEIDLLKQLADKYKTQKRGLMQRMLTGFWRIAPDIVRTFGESHG